MIKIEIVAIGKNKIYSVGTIKIYSRGDIYVVSKIKGFDGLHTSRHRDGNLHHKANKFNFFQKIRKGEPINTFKGIEFIYNCGFGLNSLPEIYKEYKIKKCNGVFAFDMREYENSDFNMTIAILTEEGLSSLYKTWGKLKKKQIYLYVDCKPMIAIMVADAKINTA